MATYIKSFKSSDKYPIDKKVCKNCIYRSGGESDRSATCDYILIVGHMRPTEKSNYNYCEAKRTKKD